MGVDMGGESMERARGNRWQRGREVFTQLGSTYTGIIPNILPLKNHFRKEIQHFKNLKHKLWPF
jgi:hypothetical protein